MPWKIRLKEGIQKQKELRKLSGWERIKLGLPAKPIQPVDLTYIKAPKKTKEQLLKRFYSLNRFQQFIAKTQQRTGRFVFPEGTFRLYFYYGYFRISVTRNWDGDKHLVKLLYEDNFKNSNWICSSYIKGNYLDEKFITLQIQKIVAFKKFKCHSQTLIPV